METWDNNNLPENHQLFEKVTFVAVVEGTWNRKKQDGTNETAKKWDYITQETEEAPAMQISVYSSTDNETLQLNTLYDIICKKSVGKDGTFYGYTLKGFGESGKPIAKKEPTSRFQKTMQANNKAIALQATATIHSGSKMSPDDIIIYAEVLEAWLKNEYKPIVETPFDNIEDNKETKK